jgi:putative SOS response-associated peptidase YedK
MCGRYVAKTGAADLAAAFEAAMPDEELHADYNVAPTKKVYAVVDRAPQSDADGTDGTTAEADGDVRSLLVARWGLVPSWAKDPSIGSRMINARAETVAEKPAFRRAFAKRRCLLPADGYYEWYTPTDPDAPAGKGGKPLKQPFYIHRSDDRPLALAGLYEWWRDDSRPDDDPQAWLLTCTVITTSSTDELGRIHERMPMTVAQADWAAWLDRSRDGAGAAELLRPAAAAGLDAYPVSTLVNAVRNNGPELLEPVEAVV